MHVHDEELGTQIGYPATHMQSNLDTHVGWGDMLIDLIGGTHVNGSQGDKHTRPKASVRLMGPKT